MSSRVLTIHNFGVPNFDPYPYVNKNRLLMFDVVLLMVFSETGISVYGLVCMT